MTLADIDKLADGEDESPMGPLLRALADVVKAAKDHACQLPGCTNALCKALARVEALKL